MSDIILPNYWEEEWKDVKGFEGLYQVSNLGRVKSLDGKSNHRGEIILKPITDKYGYYRVHLYKNAKLKTALIHRLVTQAFIPNPDDLPCVNHKDENKLNNNVSNLEWCDNKYNNLYGNRLNKVSKSLGKQVLCVETGKIYHSVTEAYRQTGVDFSSIAKNCKGIRAIAGGYHWKYIDSEVV